jgi:RND family efflux transporter MFP subunit
MAFSFFQRLRFSLGWVLLLFFVAAASWFFLKPERKQQVELVSVISGPSEQVLALNGRVRVQDRADILPRIQGRILEMKVDDGSEVKAGDVLAQLENNRETAKIKELESEVKSAELRLAQSKRDLLRAEKLLKEGFVSKERLENLRLEQDQAQQRVQSLKAELAGAKVAFQDSIITAPFDGVILRRLADLGQTVDPRTILFEMISNAPRDIEAEADEIYAVYLRQGMDVRLKPIGSSETLTGSLSYIAPDISLNSGGRLIRVTGEGVSNLPPGLSVDLTILVDRKEKALMIPRSAILDPAENPRVRVVNAQNKVEEKKIETRDWPAEFVAVLSGLTEQDKIISVPRSVQVGQEVEIKSGTAGRK